MSVSGEVIIFDNSEALPSVPAVNWELSWKAYREGTIEEDLQSQIVETGSAFTAIDGSYSIASTNPAAQWIEISFYKPESPEWAHINWDWINSYDLDSTGINETYVSYGQFGNVTDFDIDLFYNYPVTVIPDRGGYRWKCDCPDVWSTYPVRFADGVVKEGATDLSADGYGMPFAQTRSWSNGAGYAVTQTNGNGWVNDTMPTLVRGSAGAIGMVYAGAEAQWFDYTNLNGGTYVSRHDAKDTLVFGIADDSSGDREFVYTSAVDGSQVRFFDLDDTSLPSLQRGSFKSQQSPGAARLSVFSVDSAGRPTDLRRSITVGGVTTVESWKYDYLTSGANTGKLERVTLRRSTDAGSTWDIVRQVEYSYYEGTSSGEYSFGELGDLRSAEIQDAASTAIDTWYYRYYRSGESNGYTGGMKYVLEPEQYARLAASLSGGTTPLTASNSAVAPFASRAYQYDGSQRVTQEIVAATGTNQSSGDGRGTIGFAYYTNPNVDPADKDYNAWVTRTTETRPDGAQNIVFTNHVGRVMLWVKKDNSTGQSFSGQKVATFYRYDSAGRLLLTAHPSAFDPDSGGNLYNETYDDLLNDQGGGDYEYLGDNFGQLDLIEYATTTTADHDTAGDISGLAVATYTQRGDTGAPILISETQYYEKTYTPGGTGAVESVVRPVASTTVYPNAVEGTPGTGRTTDFIYDWHEDGSSVDTNAIKSIETRLHIVSTTANGPGGSTRDTSFVFFDTFGNPTWSKDAEGYINYIAYDLVTGATTKVIADVDTTQTGTFVGKPSGWSTVGTGGLHLKTEMTPDTLGRATKVVDPKGNVTHTVYNDTNHEVRVYQGWDATSHTTTGPILVSRTYRPAANASSGQRTLYYESLTSSAAPSYNGTTNEPTGTETLDSANIQSLSRTITNDAGQVTDVNDYFSLAGVTYAVATAVLGTSSNDSSTGNYYRSQVAYDAAGRANRLKNAAGTITRTVWDGRGNAISEWVGTDDTGATDLDPDGSGSGNNLVKVSEAEYDESCGCPSSSGDGNITKLTLYPGGGAANRVTEHFYDWRGREVAVKSGVESTEGTDVQRQITYVDLNNLGQVTASYLYDGDNVTVSETNGVPNKPSSSLLRAKSAASYDEQLRPYRTSVFSVNQSDGTVSSDSLDTDAWYDRRGNAIKTAAPGGMVSKSVFNGVGWITASYASDGGGDSAWTDADDVSGDKVLEQAGFTYDKNGNVTLTTAKQRFHDETGTGELGTASSGNKARVSYTAGFYDKIDRPTASANVGTNGGSAYSWPGSVPLRSDTVLVDSYTYDAAGNLYEATDPRGIVTRSAYDLLGQQSSNTEAYTDGTPSAADDRITRYTYDGIGNVLTMTADLPGGSNDQTTQYVYGVTIGSGNQIAANDLLKEVRYPNASTGAAGTATSDKVQYAYNAVGETVKKTDKNGNVHEYAYDVLSRFLSDSVTTLGSGVDGAVRRLATTYNTQGLAEKFTSYDAATSGSVVNEVQRAYNGLGQIITEYQAHSGAVNTGSSPKVQYAYSEMASGANHSRLKSMTYPDGRVLRYEYASGLDSDISRISYLADDSGGSVGTHLEEYSYLGLGSIVRKNRPEPGVELTYIKQGVEGNGEAGDQYAGLDRFGRIRDQRWLDTSAGTHTDRWTYGYDVNSNPLFKKNELSAGMSELYHANGASGGYDKLDRLTDFRRGTLSDANSDGVMDTVATATQSQGWSLDALGNPDSVTTDGTPESRTHNDKNQVTEVGAADLSYDAAGNVTALDTSDSELTYDAWNRLVGWVAEPVYGGNEYDALGRRVVETTGPQPESDGTYSRTDLYYSASWQVVEEATAVIEVVDETPGSPANTLSQYVWGIGYVDDLVLRDRNADANGGTGDYGKAASGLEERLYAQQDANHNVTVLVDPSGVVQQRFIYDPYGVSTVLDASWIGTTDAYNWHYRHQGTRWMEQAGLYDIRNRFYSPLLMRWMQEDPAGYVDGSNLFSSRMDNPVSFVDPWGTESQEVMGPFAFRWNPAGYAEMSFQRIYHPSWYNYLFHCPARLKNNTQTYWVRVPSLEKRYASQEGIARLRRWAANPLDATDRMAPRTLAALNDEIRKQTGVQQTINAATNAVGVTGLGPTGEGLLGTGITLAAAAAVRGFSITRGASGSSSGPAALTDPEALSQGMLVHNAKVKPSDLKGAPAGPSGPAGHSASKHQYTDDMVAEIINNAERRFVGVNHRGRRVNVFCRQGSVVITEDKAVNSIITAYGPKGITKTQGGRVAPGKAVDPANFANDPLMNEVK